MPKPKQFNYTPMYYNERKERLDKMKSRAEAEVAAEKSGTRLQRGFLAENREKSKLGHVLLGRPSIVRMLIFVLLIFCALYQFYRYMPDEFLAFWHIK